MRLIVQPLTTQLLGILEHHSSAPCTASLLTDSVANSTRFLQEVSRLSSYKILGGRACEGETKDKLLKSRKLTS